MKKTLGIAVICLASMVMASEQLDNFISGVGPTNFVSSVSVIRSHTFAGHRSVKVVELPYVTKLPPAVFINCRLLEKVSLPAVTNVDSLPGTFSGCPNLTHIDLSSIEFNATTRSRFPWGVTNPRAIFIFRNGRYDINGNRVL